MPAENLLVKAGGRRKVAPMQTHRFFVTVASLLTVAAAQADVYVGLGVATALAGSGETD